MINVTNIIVFLVSLILCHRWQTYVKLIVQTTSENISVDDILRTCPKLTDLKLYRRHEDDAPSGNDIKLHYDQTFIFPHCWCVV